jgi:hypothetical protein
MHFTWNAQAKKSRNVNGHPNYMGKCKQKDKCPQHFKCPQCKQETHLAEFQPTVIKHCPTATKQKETVPIVEEKVKSLLSMNRW